MRLALVIGNSRLHWAVLSERSIHTTWNTDHLSQEAIAALCTQPVPLNALLNLGSPRDIDGVDISLPLLVVSVVPEQTSFWQQSIQCQLITLDQIPLKGLYSTMGIDRAIAALGAGHAYGFPVLIIDGGTALTLTGIDGDRRVMGGAILPGLRLQGRSLTQYTATLPTVEFSISSPVTAIPRWAHTTPDAIRSGITHTVLSGVRDFIEDWHRRYPDGGAIFTGGDGEFLYHHLHSGSNCPENQLRYDPTLIFRGIQSFL